MQLCLEVFFRENRVDSEFRLGECDLEKREKNSASEDCREQQSSKDLCEEGFIRCELRLWLSGKPKIGHAANNQARRSIVPS